MLSHQLVGLQFLRCKKPNPTYLADFLWPLEKGKHIAQAKIWLSDASLPLETPKVSFIVK